MNSAAPPMKAASATQLPLAVGATQPGTLNDSGGNTHEVPTSKLARIPRDPSSIQDCRLRAVSAVRRFSVRREGQSLIEVALFLPIFVTLICYAVDFGYFFLAAASLDSAARNAVEYSIQGLSSPSKSAEPTAAVVSSLAIAGIGLSGATAATVSVRVCSSAVGVTTPANTSQCASPATGGGAVSGTPDTDPESPTFQLNRVDVVYTVTPPVPMPVSILPTLSFHRMVEMRSLQ
jgi:Flp pilus assembly protein TadG